MLTRITYPPMDALRPLLPGVALPDESVREGVAAIIRRVVTGGDAEVRALTRELDGVDLAADQLELPRSEWEAALGRLDPALRKALELAVERVRTYHEHQREPGFTLSFADGSEVGMRVTPVDRVGLYVPGGQASYPSSVIMNAVPAAVAGVGEIIAVTPPRGFLSDTVLAACALAGVHRIFRVGGAQAVAALAYGTDTIPRVDVIVGPGNKWVAEAKRQVVGQVGIDMVAGPTEVLVIADDSADPARIAADLIAQAEHDEDAASWCVTTSAALADALPAALEAALAKAPRAAIARVSLERNGVCVVVPTIEHAVEVSNLRAPEHREIVTRDAERVAGMIRHAGAIFIGDATPEPVGDYIAGPSHVLPTSGTARYASPLGVHHFVKRTSLIRSTAARLAADAPHVIALAESEQLAGHAQAVRIRVGG